MTDSECQADYFGRRVGMGAGCFVTICATMLQTFAPKGNLGCFMAGRVIVGVGQGMALSKCPLMPLFLLQDLDLSTRAD